MNKISIAIITASLAGGIASGVVQNAYADSSYSVPQLEQLWISAGGDPSKACVAAAVAHAESGGNPNAISPTNDWGLWQINKDAHPSLATLSSIGSAKAAITISNNGNNWAPWSVYGSVNYEKGLSKCSNGSVSSYNNVETTPAPTASVSPSTGATGAPKPNYKKNTGHPFKMPTLTYSGAPGTTVMTGCGDWDRFGYIVKSGDTLSSIGRKFDVTWKAVYKDVSNKSRITDANVIYPHELVCIPYSSTNHQ